MNFCPRCASPLAETVIDDQPRHACSQESCGYIFWNNPTPVVAIIVEVEDGVVLARNVNWPETFYSIITGFLEPGEDPAECARRETLEELSLNCESVELVGVYPFADQNQVIIAYHAKAQGEIALNEELADYKIIAIDKLKGWDMGTGLAINDWLAKVR